MRLACQATCTYRSSCTSTSYAACLTQGSGWPASAVPHSHNHMLYIYTQPGGTKGDTCIRIDLQERLILFQSTVLVHCKDYLITRHQIFSPSRRCTRGYDCPQKKCRKAAPNASLSAPLSIGSIPTSPSPLRSFPLISSTPILELLHEILPHCPHSCPFAVDIHWYCCCQTCQLNSADRNKRLLHSVGI